MTSSRHHILERLKRYRKPAEAEIYRSSDKFREDNCEHLLTNLVAQLKLNRIELCASGAESWQEQLQLIAKENDFKHWLVGTHTGVAEHAREILKTLPPNKIFTYDQSYEAMKDILFDQVDVSITGAYAAIAETGTLILKPDQYEPRMMSLVPPVHIAVLDTSKIFATMASFTDHLIQTKTLNPSSAQSPSNLLFISSPSKTADIQQKLAFGAHGPKRVMVLLHNSEALTTIEAKTAFANAHIR